MEEKKEIRPDIIGMLRKIDEGELQVTEVDWQAYVHELVYLCDLIKMPRQSFGWLYGLFTQIRDFDVRRECLEEMAYIAEKETFRQAERLADDFHCMANIVDELKRVERYGPSDGDPKELYYPFTWRQEGTGYIEGVRYRGWDEILRYYTSGDRSTKLFYLSQQLCRTAESGVPDSVLCDMVYAMRHYWDFETENMVDFCKYLYLAQGHVCLLLKGIDNYNELPKYVEFDKELRDGCFDEYVHMRLNKLSKYDKDTEEKVQEFYEHLYHEAKISLDHELELNSYRDTIVYERTWRKGRQGVNDLLHYLVSYLEHELKCFKKGEQLPAMIQTQSVTIGTNNAPITSIENSHVDLH